MATIRGKVQNRIADTTTNTWSGTDWITFFNDCTYEILNDIIANHAWEVLADALHASTTITMVADTESYDYYTAITNDSKTFYHFIKATWGTNTPKPVRVIPWNRYEQLKLGRVIASQSRPFMAFYGSKTFYLQPTPDGNTETFTFYYLQKPTDVDSTDDKTSLDERTVQLYEPKLAEKYWQRRRRYDLAKMEGANYHKGVREVILPHRRYPMTQIISMDEE